VSQRKLGGLQMIYFPFLSGFLDLLGMEFTTYINIEAKTKSAGILGNRLVFLFLIGFANNKASLLIKVSKLYLRSS